MVKFPSEARENSQESKPKIEFPSEMLAENKPENKVSEWNRPRGKFENSD